MNSSSGTCRDPSAERSVSTGTARRRRGTGRRSRDPAGSRRGSSLAVHPQLARGLGVGAPREHVGDRPGARVLSAVGSSSSPRPEGPRTASRRRQLGDPVAGDVRAEAAVDLRAGTPPAGPAARGSPPRARCGRDDVGLSRRRASSGSAVSRMVAPMIRRAGRAWPAQPSRSSSGQTRTRASSDICVEEKVARYR